MVEEILANITSLNLNPPNPGGAYNSVNVRGNLVFVSIQFPIHNEEFMFRGRVGDQISTNEAAIAAEICALNVIAQVHKYVGFEKIEGLNHVDIYYQQEEGWDEGPKVADGASKFFNKVLLKAGSHSRSIFGVQHLPRNFSVGITASFSLSDIKQSS